LIDTNKATGHEPRWLARKGASEDVRTLVVSGCAL
jgi:hypothetical protein